jgi:C-5 cytosine-specific DNA methylase
LLACLDSSRPWAMLAENVEGLMSQVPFMKQQVNALGYKFHVLRLDAQDFCLPQKRPRVFFVIVSDIGEPVRFNDIDAIVSLLRTSPLDIRDILKKAGHGQQSDAMGTDGDAASKRSGVRVSREHVGARDAWVKRHEQIFRDADLPFVIPTDSELGTTAPDGVLALSLRERSIVQFWTLRGHVSGFLDLSEALERFQPIHETCLSCITTSATHFDFVEQNTVPLRALWDVQGLDWDAWTELGRYPPRLLKDLAANAFSIPTIAAVLIAMFTVLPWPSSADEHQVWARCRVSGPPQTPAHRSSQSNGAGVSGSGCSGSASDDDDDGAGSGGRMGFGSHGANVSETRSVMNQASSRQTDEDAAFQADMQDLELLASLG